MLQQSKDRILYAPALLAGFFSWLAPRARWAINIAMFASITIFAILGYSPPASS